MYVNYHYIYVYKSYTYVCELSLYMYVCIFCLHNVTYIHAGMWVRQIEILCDPLLFVVCGNEMNLVTLTQVHHPYTIFLIRALMWVYCISHAFVKTNMRESTHAFHFGLRHCGVVGFTELNKL